MNRDAKWLAWFETLFTEIAGEDRQISLDEFRAALKVSKVHKLLSIQLIYLVHILYTTNAPAIQDSFFAERFFTLFDEDKSGSISLRELINGVTVLSQGTEEDKLQFLFRVYDVDG